MSQVAGRDGLVMMSVAIPLDAAAHIRPLIRDNQPRDTRAKGRFLEGFLHCRRVGMRHWLKRDQGQVFQLQASRRIRQSAQPDADDREALHHADLDRVVDEIGPIASPLQGPVQGVPPQPHQPTTNRRPGHHATRCATTEEAEDGRQDPRSGAKRQLDGRHQVNRQGDAPDGPAPAHRGRGRELRGHQGGKLLPRFAANRRRTEHRGLRRRMTGLADSVLTGSLTPFSGPVSAPFSVPCGAVSGADNWANSCPRCSERSGNSCDCDSTIDCVAWAEQVLASLARAARATCPAIAPQQPPGCATACSPSGSRDTWRAAYCGLSTTIAPGSGVESSRPRHAPKSVTRPLLRPPCLVPSPPTKRLTSETKSLVATSRKCHVKANFASAYG